MSSKAIAKLLQVSAKRIITINPHKEHILNYFDVPALALDASPLIGRYFKKKRLDSPVVVAPDSGSKDLAQRVADILGCRCESLEKKRLGPGRVVTSADKVKLKGDDVVIVDDIIDFYAKI